jgi:hypothetical protein
LTSVGVAFREIKGKLFPSVGMKKSGEHVRVNFGQSPFVFDIDGMMLVRIEEANGSFSPISPASFASHPNLLQVPILVTSLLFNLDCSKQLETFTSLRLLVPSLRGWCWQLIMQS